MGWRWPVNDEQLDLARRLAAHPRFHPERGMVWHHNDAGRGVAVDDGWGIPLVRECYENSGLYREDGWVPDLTDAATGGVLLDMLGPNWNSNRTREWDEANDGPDRDRWFVWKTAGMKVVYRGTTLAEACARALLAEWGEG